MGQNPWKISDLESKYLMAVGKYVGIPLQFSNIHYMHINTSSRSNTCGMLPVPCTLPKPSWIPRLPPSGCSVPTLIAVGYTDMVLETPVRKTTLGAPVPRTATARRCAKGNLDTTACSTRASSAPSETSDQQHVAAWLRSRPWNPPIAFFHPANEGRRTRKQGAALCRMGLSKGVPDLVIVTPPPASPQYVGMVIELKRARTVGTRAPRDYQGCSPEQIQWLATFQANGWLAVVCYGAAQAIAVLLKHGY